MSALANLTVYDGAATPVLHTLVPIRAWQEKGAQCAEWREMIASLPTEAQVSAVTRQVTLKSGVKRKELNVFVPVMESITNQNAAGYTAAPKVAYVDRYDIVNYSHPRSTITGRRTARMLAVNAANNVTTSVAAATTGAIPELFDQEVSAS